MTHDSDIAPMAQDNGVPPWATDLGRSVLMSIGAGLIAKGYVSSIEWPQIVGGLLAAFSAVWSYVAKHPSKVSVLNELRGLIKASGAANAASYDGALTAAEAYALAQALPVINKVIAAHIPKLLRAPVDQVADQAARTVADQAVDHLRI